MRGNRASRCGFMAVVISSTVLRFEKSTRGYLDIGISVDQTTWEFRARERLDFLWFYSLRMLWEQVVTVWEDREH